MSDLRPSWRERLSDSALLDRSEGRHLAAHWSDTSHRGMVAAAHYRATRVGVDVLDRGGNAIDAAVATSLALAVVESAGSGIGGMAMMLVHAADPGKTAMLAGPCRAPLSATPALVKKSRRYSGYRAVAVPTYLSVIDAAISRYGTMSASSLLEPAIELAEDGFLLTAGQAQLIADKRFQLAKFNAGAFFLDENGSPPAAGSVFRQPVLAKTLRRLAKAGLRDFYEGEIAALIAADMSKGDGFVSAEDLRLVPVAADEDPICAPFLGRTVRTAGPPAGGRTLVQMLNLFTELAPPDFDIDTPDGAHLIADIIRRARSDRRHYRLDSADSPNYASVEYAKQAAAQMRHKKEAPGVGETSHISVIDEAGNAVSLTQSIERSFGSKVVTPELGFLHNGYMKGFKIQANEHPHYLKKGAVARSNAAPTMLFDQDDRIALAIGSTGSERMLSGIFQVLIRLHKGESPFSAVHAPRLHATPESVLLVELSRFRPHILEHLTAHGYIPEDLGTYGFRFGGLHMVARADDGSLAGVADPRRDGSAAGP